MFSRMQLYYIKKHNIIHNKTYLFILNSGFNHDTSVHISKYKPIPEQQRYHFAIRYIQERHNAFS